MDKKHFSFTAESLSDQNKNEELYTFTPAIQKQLKSADDMDFLPSQIFDIIQNIQDPERPQCLAQLDVVQEDLVEVHYHTKQEIPYIQITWVPTVPNCHLAMTIALCIKTKLNDQLPLIDGALKNCKIDILVQDGKHQTKSEIDKQVNDKERVLAAMEQEHIRNVIDDLIKERNFY